MAKKPRCPRCGSDSRVPDLVWTSCSHPWHQMAASPAPAQEPCVWRDSRIGHIAGCGAALSDDEIALLVGEIHRLRRQGAPAQED